jgi:HD-GYP domain-containing protein (c-di-GMP phosphodiesterase class II)
LSDAKDVVGFHHEKVDASGYLEGLKDTDIPITARIFAIADVFDALTSKRPYKEPLSFEETMDILEKGKGLHFDTVFLDAFGIIAREVYDDITNQGDDEIHKDLDKIIEKYFSGDFDVLKS